MRTAQARPEVYPAPVDVLIGAEWVSATSHAEQLNRHGHQVLISHHGHLMWVAAHRVRPRDSDANAHGPRHQRRGVFA